jgi:hypothetical protein
MLFFDVSILQNYQRSTGSAEGSPNTNPFSATVFQAGAPFRFGFLSGIVSGLNFSTLTAANDTTRLHRGLLAKRSRAVKQHILLSGVWAQKVSTRPRIIRNGPV